MRRRSSEHRPVCGCGSAKKQVELASESIHRGLGIRAVVNGAVGFSSTSDMTLLESVACSAVQSARARGQMIPGDRFLFLKTSHSGWHL